MKEVDSTDVHAAYKHWCEFCHKKEYKTNTRAFLDYLDPVKASYLYQTDLDDNHSFTTLSPAYVVSEQTYRRIMLLAGPYSYAALKANEDRFKQAHFSWGKKLPQK